ncbi:hypothetical protein FJ414_01945 [Mesorhizobium sp. B3-1-6]|uniref:hypothetical protein n=1 Tax=Mesorhizobium sp. B3-1-6 TaxID=2589895 RepID=UPI00112EE175|nr:hypothetical protein [Mesorhizobium sp. B3-1-6]TPI44503.1 hypothetical protein FJ414_01945 [Mesorhizobium sp. B3-1-6]
MASLNEFLASRHRALLRARAERQRELASIEEEIRQIEKAAQAAEIVIPDEKEMFREKIARVRLPTTIKEAAIEALTDEPLGMTANAILKVVNEKLGTDYPRSSLSPQLSRLKGEGVVYREDDRWVLVPK